MPPKQAANKGSQSKTKAGKGRRKGKGIGGRGKKQWSITGFNYLALPSEIKLMIMKELDKRALFALSGTCSQLLLFDAARRYAHVVIKPRFKFVRLKCLINTNDALAVLRFLENVADTPYKASLLTSLTISVYTDYGKYITNDEERLDLVEYITNAIEELPNLSTLTYINSEKHQLSTEFVWRHEGITTLSIGMLRVFFMEYEGEWPELLIRGCPNLSKLTIYVFEYPTKTTFTDYLNTFLPDKLGVWLAKHGDMLVEMAGVTTAAGRYYGQFYNIAEDIKTKAARVDVRTFFWESQQALFWPRGQRTWSNSLTKKEDIPLATLKKDPDHSDDAYIDADINSSQSKQYYNYFFRLNRQAHYVGQFG